MLHYIPRDISIHGGIINKVQRAMTTLPLPCLAICIGCLGLNLVVFFRLTSFILLGLNILYIKPSDYFLPSTAQLCVYKYFLNWPWTKYIFWNLSDNCRQPILFHYSIQLFSIRCFTWAKQTVLKLRHV